MPTGYTAAVCEGRQTEFKDFAMSCARAFGACIDLRDAPADAPIPEEFAPSSYHAERLAEATTRLEELRAMSPDAAAQAAAVAYQEKMTSYRAYEAQREASDKRIDAMLAKVNAWVPPTSEHSGMKNFMLEQLRISKSDDYRSAEPVRLAGWGWREAEMSAAMRDIAYHSTENAKEIRRTAERNEWVKALRVSLEGQP